VGGPNARITNPRWRMAAILKRSKNRHISATTWLIGMKFGTVTHIDLHNRIGDKKLIFLEIQDGRGPLSWKIEKGPYIGNGLTDRHENWNDVERYPHLKFQNFKNPRCRTTALLKNRKSTIYQQQFDRLTLNSAKWRTLTLRTVASVININF